MRFIKNSLEDPSIKIFNLSSSQWIKAKSNSIKLFCDKVKKKNIKS